MIFIIIFFTVLSYSLNYSVKSNSMKIKNRGDIVLLDGNIGLESEKLHVKADKSIWNKKEDILKGYGNIYFVYRSTYGVVTGNSNEFIYYGRKKVLELKKISNIMYNYKVNDSTSVVFLEGDNAFIDSNKKNIKITGEKVILKTEEFLSKGKEIFYDESLKKLDISGLDYIKSLSKGVYIKGGLASFYTDKKIVFIKDNVKGKINIEDVKSNKP